jgi:hypothetical protein
LNPNKREVQDEISYRVARQHGEPIL